MNPRSGANRSDWSDWSCWPRWILARLSWRGCHPAPIGPDTERDPAANGLASAGILAESWRSSRPAWDGQVGALTDLVPTLLETGAGGLAWARVRGTKLETTSVARELHQAYRLYTIQSAIQQQHLAELLTRLRAAGVEPLLVKGWSVARLYPEAGLRPAGDMDLCVLPQEMPRAMEVLRQAAGRCGSVDLHAGVADLDRPMAEVLARSRLVTLGSTEVRVLGAEDQLRHLCLHLMRHGGWRPLWLCDVALTLESLPAYFDWDCCLSGRRWRTNWVRCTLGLARELLGARVDQAEAAGPVPAWLVNSVLQSWGRGAGSNDAVAQSITASLGSWARFREAVRQRWPNPIRAAFKLRQGPRAKWSVLPMQLLAFLKRAAQFAVSARRPVSPAGAFSVHPSQVR